MDKNVMPADMAEEAVGNILKDISGAAQEVISGALDRSAEMLKDSGVRYFIGKVFKQWRYGEKLTNPIITFTKELKRGAYDNLFEDEVERIHDAALRLSVFWRSTPELSADEFKSSLGHIFIQEIIIGMMGRAKSGNSDLKTAIEALSWEK